MLQNIIKKIYSNYFEVFTEYDTEECCELHPEMLIIFYKGRKRRKVISIQQTN